jgi:hypothetical protein
MAAEMSVLRSLETKLAGLVEGTFGRVFRTEVRPVELARKLAREMDENKTVSVSRTYVPNEYVVWLSPDDRERFDGVEQDVIDELAAYLLEHARRERLALSSRPQISFQTDERLSLGEFGIQARNVRATPEAPAEAAVGDDERHGHTMVYSTAGRMRDPVAEVQGSRATRALVLAEGRRHVVAAGGATIGRSRECDIVLGDANVSRKHAEIRPAGDGWSIADLGSTNGVRVNGRAARDGHPLAPGDRVELGTARLTFDVE